MQQEIFSKSNSSNNKDALYKEVEGLKALANHLKRSNITELSIPMVKSVDDGLLRIQKIHRLTPSEYHMKRLAKGLAKMHRAKPAGTINCYGYKEDNYIGVSSQKNILTQDWGDFFYHHRLMHQILLIDNTEQKNTFMQQLELCRSFIIELLNSSCQRPSLVHGDLWSGNVLFSEGKVWLIDPAVYFADSEVDIAMSEMFGGFSAAFYQTYQQQLPLSAEYPIKKEVYNLYHYLNHYNMFGNSYLSSCTYLFERLIKQSQSSMS